MRRILENSKIIITYSYVYNCAEINKKDIIKKIRELDIRNSIILVNMLLSDINTQFYYQMIYWYKYKDSIKKDRFEDNLLFSKQGLLYLFKWILAYGDYNKKKKMVIIEDTIDLLHLQIIIADYLDKDEINPLTYIHKNYYLNSRRNIVNDISRAVYIFEDLASKSELYDTKEYINIPKVFKDKYEYSIKEYMASVFSLYYFHIGDNRYKVVNLSEFLGNINNKITVRKVLNEMYQRYYCYKEWAIKTIDNSWDYEELVKFPLIQLSSEEYVSLDESFIINKFFEALYYKIIDIYASKRDRDKIISFLGIPFEIYRDSS